MKDKIQLTKKYFILIIVIFIVIIIVATVFFTKNYISHQKELKSLITKEINGHIVSLKDENRGSYYIEIKSKKETYKIHSFPIAWEIKEYNIQIGDSLSKDENNNTITFYKLRNGNYEKSCTYKMY